MKMILVCSIFLIGINSINAQSCTELMNSIKSDNYGTTYYSPTSDAIVQVTFYDITIEYQYYYFAIVKFKNSYSYKEYLYQVSSTTKLNYSMNYLQSAGKAFWKYINPHNENLNCAPDFE